MIKYIANISRDGISQDMRFLNPLKPGSSLVDDRTIKDWLRLLRIIAEQISFYNENNLKDGDWRQFFPAETDMKNFISELGKTSIHPYSSLLIAFLRLLTTVTNDINKLTEKHLRYYYENVLLLRKADPVADKVHILFELAKHVKEPEKIAAGTRLLAGKDTNGRNIFYQTVREVIVNKASIENVRNVFVDFSDEYRIYASPVANSADGKGKQISKEENFWYPFGESQKGKIHEERSMPDAEVGFGISSPILLLKEGKREILITVTVESYTLTESNINKLESDGLPGDVIQKILFIKDQQFDSVEMLSECLKNLLDEQQYSVYLNLILNEIYNPLRHLGLPELYRAFNVKFSSVKGYTYLETSKTSCTKSGENKLVFSIMLDRSDQGIVGPLNSGESEKSLLSAPSIVLFLNHSNRPFLYNEIRNLKLKEAYIQVNVNGIRDLVLQNDQGLLDPSKPFLPFGTSPCSGSSFYFGNDEVFSKKLKSLSAELSWAELPDPTNFTDGFESYYSLYGLGLNNDSFEAAFYLLKDYEWINPDVNNPISLFDEKPESTKTLNTGIFKRDLPLLTNLGQSITYSENNPYSKNIERGFGKLELMTPDFGHSIYIKKFTDVTILKASDPINHGKDPLPNPPYTPKLNHFSLNYSSGINLDLTRKSNSGCLFHAEPFGFCRLIDSKPFLLPQLNRGTLYFGVKDLNPPQRLSILLQFVEGSSDPDIEANRKDIKWSYLSGDKWVIISEADLQIDTTYGFQTTGIIDIAVGRDASNNHYILPSGLHWLRATTDKNPTGVCKLISFKTQAATAVMCDISDKRLDLMNPLPENTISKLEIANSSIKSVKQPYPSYDGKNRESSEHFNRRISERLRHKQRTISLWDYEHMTLEAFSSIYKVKCLPHTNGYSLTSPGELTVVVIPELRKQIDLNKLQPKVSAVVREKIKLYLDRHKTLFTQIHVSNPKYEPILLEMKVGLNPGYDGGYYGKLLNEEIKRFLSPWAYEEGKDIVFGGKIYKSSILTFIEELPYVNYITDFRLFQLNRGPGIEDMSIEVDFVVRPDTIGEEMEIAEASSEASILVSALQHNITVLNTGEFICSSSEAGIGIEFMAVEVDFIID